VAGLLALAAGCQPRKGDECATVQARVLEELRMADSVHDSLRDPEAIARHVQRLRAFCAGLRALEVRDAALRVAVERYLASLDSLAEAYAGISPPSPADGGDTEQGLVTLGAVLSTHAAAVNGARSAISSACAAR
jgi:hypothetical protein